MTITIDASVLVAADLDDEEAHDDASAFLRAVVMDSLAIHQPSLTLVEVCAAVARRTSDAALARATVAVISSTPGVVFHGLDLAAASAAAEVAADVAVRGADAVYLQVARNQGATLVTLDLGMLGRSPTDVEVVTPRAWLDGRMVVDRAASDTDDPRTDPSS